MKLSMSLIAHYLRGYDVERRITEDAASIGGIRFLSDPRGALSADYVYLDRAGGYIKDERYQEALILASGHDQIVCFNAEVEPLLNDVLSAFEHYSEIERCLVSASADHSSLSVMLGIAGEVFPGPILIFDIEGYLVGAENLDSIDYEPLINRLKERSDSGTEILGGTFLDSSGREIHDLSGKPKRLFRIGPGSEFGAVCMYMHGDGERIGYIMMFPRSDAEAGLAKGLEPMVAECCARAAEFTSGQSVAMPSASALRSALTGDMPSDEVLRKLERAVGADGAMGLFVVENRGLKNYTFRRAVVREFAETGLRSVACEVDGRVAILGRAEDECEILRALESKMVRGNYSVGVSMPLSGATLLPSAYRQAAFALGGGEPGVRRCRDLAPDYLVSRLAEQDMALELMHPSIRILEAYDSGNGTELLETLRGFLAASCNKSVAAPELGVHLNTLKYRLGRISEIGGIDFSSEPELFYLRLSLMILDKAAAC